MRVASLVLAVGLTPLFVQEMSAQEIRLPASLDRLSQKAEESVDITLDGPLLKMAGRFLSDKDQDEAKVKKLVAKLDGIYVRCYQFAEDGAYDRADVESVRSQLQAPAWGRVVGVKSKRDGENVDVYLKVPSSNELGGLVIIVAGPRELAFINIVGTIQPEDVVDLSGHFNIPGMRASSSDQWREER